MRRRYPEDSDDDLFQPRRRLFYSSERESPSGSESESDSDSDFKTPPPRWERQFGAPLKPEIDYDSEDEILIPRRRLRYPVETEVLGKTFERAVCDALHIPYQGKYNYSSPPPDMVRRLEFLHTLIDRDYQHTADRGGRYDFTSSDRRSHISAKTSRYAVGSVAPQVLGQASLQRFAREFSAPEDNLKVFIQENISKILPRLMDYTFDCPNLYYNQALDKMYYITLLSPIEWETEEFEWTRRHDEWTNSTTLKVRGTPILEIQLHSKTRKNLAIRWKYDNLLRLFRENFRLVEF